MVAIELEWERVTLKNGKPGKRLQLVGAYYTPIRYCELCGKFGPPRKVCIRDDVYGWNRLGPDDYTTESKSMLCTGCWNKVRPLCRKEEEVRKLRVLINKMLRTTGNEQKQGDQNNRRAS